MMRHMADGNDAMATSIRQRDQAIIDQRAAAWNTRPLLRDVYAEYFNRMRAYFAAGASPANPHGTIVELGGGAGHFRTFLPNMIVTDILPTPHIDLAADAMHLPFRNSSINNIVMQDVLHHIPLPLRFFSEAQRVLKAGGRVIMTEPFISPVSGLCYRLSHPEPVDMTAPLFRSQSNPISEDPVAVIGSGAFASNQAIPTLLFYRYYHLFERRFPQLRVIHREVNSTMVYPLSGGFSKPVLLPRFAAPAAKMVERMLSPLARWMAFRTLIVVEKRS
jgi:SAM-dependent methyltransferase